MRYISTRGLSPSLSFAETVMKGLADDGGLFLPESYPWFGPGERRRWSGLSFQELALEILRPFVDGEIPDGDLASLIRRAYAGFSHPEITPLVRVGNQWILELFHGPTLAFKDVALQFLGRLFEYFLQRDGGFLTILGATSGDTGSAAIHGVRGRERIRIFILHPHGRVSPIQERQMTTVLDDNVHNIAIQGVFDDGQRIVKELFGDAEFRDRWRLGAVNSINWARILAQIIYYAHAWSRVAGEDPEREVVFSVPTGNFGDIFAGYVAQRMGVPIRRLILATNRNDILTRFVHSGTYRTGEVVPTVSPSMDIQVSSNFERYLYHLMGDDGAAVREMMAALNQEGEFAVPSEKFAQVAGIFTARAVGEAETLERIRRTWQESGYLLDPHTAVGVAAAEGESEAICLATAHPAKFGDAVRQAVGFEPELPPPLVGLLDKPARCQILPADAASVKGFMEKTLTVG
ncbi:MAG: threonine synthase [Magnetococcales bacterium]|nr:threonine synthase [Magnetococcales bacterium]